MKHRHIFITVLLAGLCSIARGQTSLYWFDGDHEAAMSSGVANGTISVDCSALTPGVHTLHYLYQTAKGVQSSTYSKMFVVPSEPAKEGVTSEYWFDQDYLGRKTSDIVNGIIAIDASALTPGLHSVSYQQRDADALASVVYSKIFMVSDAAPAAAAKGEYWFDTDFADRRQLALSSKAVSVELGDLSPGLHALHYHALSADGVPSTAYTKLFWIVGEAAALCAYHWWVNDLTDSIKNVSLKEDVALHTLSLDAPLLPLRTVSFHFELTGGKPMAYAKNTLNLVLDGTDGSSTLMVKDYVDYRVSEPVDATLLLPDEPQTVARPEGLRWFRVEAAKGDILSFKASTACTMQLFSATGGELWRASGDAVKKFSGCRADEDGTFYLALHDVTDTKATDVTVSYQWEAAPKGDVNLDGKVDVADIATVIDVMAAGVGADPVSARNADVNDDGAVDVADIAAIIDQIAANSRGDAGRCASARRLPE